MAFDVPGSDDDELITDGGTDRTDEIVRELRDARDVLIDIKDTLMRRSGLDGDDDD